MIFRFLIVIFKVFIHKSWFLFHKIHINHYPVPTFNRFWTETIGKCGITCSIKQYFGSGQLLDINNSNLLPFLNLTPRSPHATLMNSLVNLDDKENNKEGDKEKAEDIEEAQVFKKNSDTMILEKPKLSCHQESGKKNRTLRSYVVSLIRFNLRKC